MINKKEFAALVAEDLKTTKKDGEAIIESFLSVMTDVLSKGETVRFTGFGEFGTRVSPARNGFNPSTGEPIKIAESVKPYFKAGKTLKESL